MSVCVHVPLFWGIHTHACYRVCTSTQVHTRVYYCVRACVPVCVNVMNASICRPLKVPSALIRWGTINKIIIIPFNNILLLIIYLCLLPS